MQTARTPVLPWGCLLAAIMPFTASTPAPALAQTDAAPADAAEPPEYRAIVQQALSEFGTGNWSEAFALFKRAHALLPNARTLRGMGMAAYEMRDYVQALVQLQAALGDPRKPLTAEQRIEAERVIAQASGFVARYRIAVQPQAAAVTVDGKPAETNQAGEVLLAHGKHEIEISAAGYEPMRTSIAAEPGEVREVGFELSKAGHAAPPAAGTVPEPTPGAAPDRTWVWVAGGASLALAGAGLAFYLAADGEYGDVEDACPRDACTADEIRGRIDDGSGKTLDALAVTSFVLSGAAAATAVTLLLVSNGGERDPESQALSLQLAPGKVHLRGSF